MSVVDASLGSGNTKALAKKTFKIKSKNIMMTIPETLFWRQPIIIEYLEKFANFNYMLICEHDGPEKVHRHLYVQYTKDTQIDKSELGDVHIDHCFGSAQQCIAYLRGQEKEGKHKALGVNCTDVYENGIPNYKGFTGITVEEAIKLTEDEILKLPARLHNTVRKIQADHAARPMKFTETYKPDIEVIYLFGKSDLGKTKWIYDYFKAFGDDEPLCDKCKFDGKYWTGFTENMIWGVYDEWRDYHMTASEFISFIDYYVNKMRVLYGYKNNFYKHILITTVQDLHEIYINSKEDPFQWYKRITKVINIDKNIEMSGRDYFKTRTKMDVNNIFYVKDDRDKNTIAVKINEVSI